MSIMEIIPIITLKNNKIQDDLISFDNISQYFNEGEKIYVLDLDGIEKNKPNLCWYQKVSNSFDLWIDGGSRKFGDLVDIFMQGANAITVRRALIPKLNISDIKEISENKIYVNLDFKDLIKFNDYDLFLAKSDGIVNFNSKEKIEEEPRRVEYLKEIKIKTKVYCYESKVENRYFWEQFNVDGLIVDAKRIKEFKDGF
jgi:hypothetical protein